MTRLISIVKGTDISIVFTITDDAGTPLNITGYTAYFTAKKDNRDSDARAIISKSWTSHTTPASGITTLTLTDQDTNKAPGNYFWDLKLKDGSGNLSIPGIGTLFINANITTT